MQTFTYGQGLSGQQSRDRSLELRQTLQDRVQQQQKRQQITQETLAQIAYDEPIDPNEYIVGPGDRFALYIESIEAQYLELMVSPTGTFLIPSVGDINVLGLTLKEMKENVREKIKEVYANSQSGIVLTMPRIISVYLVGAVQNPGSYDIFYTSRVSDLFEHSQTSSLFKKPKRLQIIRDGDTLSLDYTQYLYEGKISENPKLLSGDIVFIGEANLGITVTGFVASPGIYPYIPGFSYVDYVGMAGGELPEGDAQRYVLSDRQNRVKSKENAVIKPGDHIFVPRSQTYVWLGDTSVLEVVTSLSSLVLAFIAAVSRLR
ncbi:MAG: polysaccharide biosynthesis/export family protein [Candidatus Marinimicrobia bacterium]|nr:polysaccharide biosynthesis/export family protein [Candidatus Neomarinimicrobiota bacterium]MCF7828561.1 polysaccharide biosynthesis/export family protein [Candidatus Neomarinimicrobiota bacterium]MCF7880302.1 polysaccharide biosynthesis/export family protein [Candidatus Neomarinimicrobiota bacterium]